jgi:hypothetical protein
MYDFVAPLYDRMIANLGETVKEKIKLFNSYNNFLNQNHIDIFFVKKSGLFLI